MKRAISEYTLYRWRYIIGYACGIALIAGLLFGAVLFVPGGLRAEELASSVISSNLNFQVLPPDAVINLPYHILQHASFSLFGVSIWSVKLASALLAACTILGLFLLIREWFRPNVAMITTMIVATLPVFIFVAQDGTPLIYSILISVWLLVSGTFISRNKKPHLLWMLLFFLLFVMNLYAPLGIYLNIALVSTMLFHPHIRHTIRTLNKTKSSIGILLGLLLAVPLLYGVSQNKHLLLVLLGKPEGSIEWLTSLKLFAKTLFDFGGSTYAGITGPILPIGIVILLLIGIFFFIRTKYTAQNYILSIWALFLIPLCVINLSYMPYLLTLIALIIATGINGLIRSWYTIFPRNPYARTAALIPLSIIVVGIMGASLMQYSASYYYDRATWVNYSNDLALLPKAIDSVKGTASAPATLVVPANKLDFYSVVAKYDKHFVATTTTPTSATPRIILGYDATEARSAYKSTYPTMIVTSRLAENSDRFYTYSNSQK